MATNQDPVPEESNGFLKIHPDPPLPPAEFNPRTASNRDLVKYGFPPRPDKSKHPLLSAKWDRVMARPPRRLPSQLKVPTSNSQPAIQNKDLGSLTINMFAGAIVQKPQDETPLVTVTGSWTVPNISPPPDAVLNNEGTLFVDGTYEVGMSVGLDGGGLMQFEGETVWAFGNDGLWAGTSSRIIVVDGLITQQDAYAWIRFWSPDSAVPLSPTPWTDVLVSPGDTVTFGVCTPAPGVGVISAVNVTTGLTWRIERAVTLQGYAATWLVGPFATQSPNFGYTWFYDLVASTQEKDHDLDDATLLNFTEDAAANTNSPVEIMAAEASPQILFIGWQ